MLDTCPICPNPWNEQHPRVTPHGNYGHWLTMRCQRRLIHCDNCATLMGNAENGGKPHVWGHNVYGKSLYLPVNFVTNLKLLKKKNKVFKKRGGHKRTFHSGFWALRHLPQPPVTNCTCEVKSVLSTSALQNPSSTTGISLHSASTRSWEEPPTLFS